MCRVSLARGWREAQNSLAPFQFWQGLNLQLINQQPVVIDFLQSINQSIGQSTSRYLMIFYTEFNNATSRYCGGIGISSSREEAKIPAKEHIDEQIPLQ